MDFLEDLLVFDSSTPDPLSLNIRAIFEDPEVRDRFLRLDPGLLRAAAKTVAIPPPSGLYTEGSGPTEAGEAEAPPPPDPVWRCELQDSTGKVCGREFQTRRALLAHQRFSTAGGHSFRSIAHTITVTNQCVYCRQTFRTRRIAQEHALGALLRRRCPRQSVFHHPVQEPAELVCPLSSISIDSV